VVDSNSGQLKRAGQLSKVITCDAKRSCAWVRPASGLRCGAVVTNLGLVFDVIGAIALLLGLFRHPKPLYPGWSYSPHDAATDHAYGITGGMFLTLGFVGQMLGNGRHALPLWETVGLAAAVLIGGAVVAYVVFKVTYKVEIRRLERWVAKRPEMAGLE
jgi:hypothetical protein